MDLQTEIAAFIREKFDIEPDDPDFTPDVHLFDYGYLDSLGAVEVIAYIEEKWNVEITQGDITLYPMNTVNEIAEVVRGKLGHG